MRHRHVHVGNALALLLQRMRYLTQQPTDLACRLHDVLHGAARLAHQPRAVLHLADAGVNQLLDLLGGFTAALGQRAHFTGHHRKTAPLIARPGGLHRRIERQDIGLESNPLNHLNDVHNLV